MPSQPIQETDVADASARLTSGGVVFVDIRDPASYAQGHIPGAVLLGHHNAAAFMQQTPKDTPLVVYCYHGHSSLSAARFLEEEGFLDVASLRGGFEAWRASQLAQSVAA